MSARWPRPTGNKLEIMMRFRDDDYHDGPSREVFGCKRIIAQIKRQLFVVANQTDW